MQAGIRRLHEHHPGEPASAKSDQADERQCQHPCGQGQQHGRDQRRRLPSWCGIQAPDASQYGGEQHGPEAMAPPPQKPKCQACRHRQHHQAQRQPASVRQDVRRHQNHQRLTSTPHFPRRARTIAESRRGVKPAASQPPFRRGPAASGPAS